MHQVGDKKKLYYDARSENIKLQNYVHIHGQAASSRSNSKAELLQGMIYTAFRNNETLYSVFMYLLRFRK
jgi:poly-gamma-glutamate capsule biosynthesis protein CapA/YwtB (metallophosphatase superfamily)